MDIVIHRLNRRKQLRELPVHFGAEIDLRSKGSQIILNHDPFKDGEIFSDWLADYEHGLLVLNIKEAGIESEVIKLTEARGVRRFFLLDVEFPYIYRASRNGERRIAIRYSEDESIETALNYRGKVDWIWIDTNTRLPLDQRSIVQLLPFKTCLVCPDRWGRPQDIPHYRAQMQALGFQPNAIMTTQACAKAWTQ